MKNELTVYCAHCQERVPAIRGIAIYRCSNCFRIILPSQIAADMDKADRKQEARNDATCT